MLGMGLVWGVIWGLVGGFVMEAIVDPHGRIGDMWPPFFAMLGFAGGALFSMMLWISEGRRRFDELSLPRLTGLGTLGGLLMGGYAASQLNPTVPLWVRAAVLISPPLLCAASAYKYTCAGPESAGSCRWPRIRRGGRNRAPRARCTPLAARLAGHVRPAGTTCERARSWGANCDDPGGERPSDIEPA